MNNFKRILDILLDNMIDNFNHIFEVVLGVGMFINSILGYCAANNFDLMQAFITGMIVWIILLLVTGILNKILSTDGRD